ncbi:MAG: nitroreductase [Desulfobacteraceae bacterium]|nr:nitroreductase [Desulfobacteraceae bacterium]
METIECIKTRMSIRGFKAEPVPKEVLLEVINIAKCSPSYKNSQPWESVILSGAKKEALTKTLIELLEKDTEPCPDLPEPTSWPAAEAERIDQFLRKRAEASGSTLNDPEALKKARKANFSFYGAPHAIYLFQEASLSSWSLFDLGLFAQTLMLTANAHGLGTVPQAFATDYAKYIKEFLSIPETKRLVIGISIGYPDMESPRNALRSDRAATDEFVKWIE